MSNQIPPHIKSLLFDGTHEHKDDDDDLRPEAKVILDVTATDSKGDHTTRVQWQTGNVPVNPNASIVDFICLEEARAMAELFPCYSTYARVGSVIALPHPDNGAAYHYRIVSHDTHHGKTQIVQQRKGLERVRRHMESKGHHILRIMAFTCLRRIGGDQQRSISGICTAAFRKFPSPPNKELELAICFQNCSKPPTERELRTYARSLLPNRVRAECHPTTEEDKKFPFQPLEQEQVILFLLALL